MYHYVLLLSPVDLPGSPTDVLRVVAKSVMWPCHTLLDGPKSLRHASEFSLDHCLLNAKGTMQNVQPFLCNIFSKKNGRGTATPFWEVKHA